MPFDLSTAKLLVLGLLALVIFGPERLPHIARDAARMLRQLRGLVGQARNELQAELGDVRHIVNDLGLSDLDPRYLIRRHLLDDQDSQAPVRGGPLPPPSHQGGVAMRSDGPPPFDPEAT
ncbi:MAG: Sec-independent protein translocase subunit TatB [Acidothermus cellulolyticus]|nr:Sec-independent protein translocase subunit TatB [Acidothermus cellulolyticus]